MDTRSFLAFAGCSNVALPNLGVFVDSLPTTRPQKLLVLGLESFILINNKPFTPSNDTQDISIMVKGERELFIRQFPQLQTFITSLPSNFEIGIWSSTFSTSTCTAVCREVFGGRNIFAWSIREAKKTIICRSDSLPVYLKPLSLIHETYPHYSSSNIVFIDNDFLSLVCNPYHTYLCPPCMNDVRFVTSISCQTFLLDILLPYLLLLGDAWDIRCFIQSCHPRWSSSTIENAQLTHAYKSLVRRFYRPCKSENKIPKYPFTILSPLEISHEDQVNIMRLADPEATWYVGDLLISSNRLRFTLDIFPKKFLDALEWPLDDVPRDSETLAREYYVEFLLCRQRLLPTDFQPTEHSMTRACNRDRKVDPNGTKGTCSIDDCRFCGKRGSYLMDLPEIGFSRV